MEKDCLKTAIRDPNPVMIFEHKLLYGSKGSRKEASGMQLVMHVPEEEYLIPFGQANIVRPGDRVTIVANLLMVHRSLQAAKLLEHEGIEVEVIDVRTLVPLDEQTIFNSVRKTGRLLVVEEDNLTAGWGAEVVARAADACLGSLEAPIRRVGAPDTPVPFAPIMENRYIPSVERIVAAVRSVL